MSYKIFLGNCSDLKLFPLDAGCPSFRGNPYYKNGAVILFFCVLSRMHSEGFSMVLV